MKKLNLRPPLLASLMLAAAFIAAQVPVLMVGGVRQTGNGFIGYDVPREVPADELRLGPYSNFNNPHLAGPDDLVEVVIELEDPPAIDAFARERGAETAPGRTNSRAVAAARAQLARIEQSQQKLVASLAGPQFGAKITGRMQRVYNGVSIQVAAGRLSEIHSLPGVRAVHLPELFYPATDTSVPFIGAHRAWDPSLPGGGFTGEGVTIAVIDSGIDYTHAHLGGSGSASVFNSNNPIVIGDIAEFPNVKVIGGVDLVGDSYNAADPNNNIPNPDPDPIDCRSNSHGTATAGIAAGVGVNANGTAYTGAYNQNINFSSFRIGPGVAPEANLYAIRVFGCNALSAASNAVVTQAIDRALDPNQDGDFSDRIRVVLLPGGGPFTTLPNSPVIAAINNGAQLNVLYVGAPGNGGDTYLAAGGPALAEGALAVVANADNGLFTQNIRVNSPANIAGSYPGAVTEFGFPLNIAFTRPVVRATPNDGCSPLTNGSLINGNIAFIDRGTCSLTTKARHAQNAGAVTVILGHNTVTLPVNVDDDGAGSDIFISSFLMAQNGADAIRNELTGGQVVNVTITPGDVTALPGLANSYASFNPYGGIYFSPSGGPGVNSTLKPDIAAPGINIGSAKAGSGNNYSHLSGTSFAAPHVAGVTALLAQKYPAATTRQVYDIIRSTGTDVYPGANSAPPPRGPSLVGGGGVDAEDAATTDARLNNSQTFTTTHLYGETIEPTSDQTIQRKIILDWIGTSAVNYNATLDALDIIPGVTVTLANPTGTVSPNSSLESPYVAEYRIGALKRLCSKGVSPTQAGNARHCLPEAQGKVIFNLGSNFGSVFAPFNFVVRPYSLMGTTQTSINLASSTGTFPINLAGQGVNNGPTLPTDWRSFVSLFELQWIDPNDDLTPPELDYFDLQHVGIRKVGDRLLWGVSTHGEWRSPNEVRHNIFIDTNRDGRDDFHLFNTSFPNAQGAPSDVQVTRLFNINTGTFAPESFFTNSFSPATLDSALYYSDVMTLPVTESLLGGPLGKFDYQVKTSFGNVVVDESARLTYDAANPGLNSGADTVFNDLPGQTIQVIYNRNNFTAANSEGIFLQHHFNTQDNRAQILLANLGVEGDVAPRPGGNGFVANIDWEQIGHFIAGLDEVNLGNEFQKADTSPRNGGGNAQLTVTDWVQAGRYAAGLDPSASAAGPYLPIILKSPPGDGGAVTQARSVSNQNRTLRAVNTSFNAGQANALQIEIDALGGENAFVFSLNFDPATLSFASAETGGDATGASMLVNPAQTAQGRVVIALALPAGQSLTVGTRRLVRANFNIVAGGTAPTTLITFSDQPVARGVANVNAEEVTTGYTSAQVSIIRAAAHVSAASFSGATLAGESIVAAFGTALATSTEVATSVPLPTSLAGTTVNVRDSAGFDRLALLFFVSAGQINYAMPVGVALGAATVTITSGSGAVSIGNVTIAAVAPGLFAANASGQGVAAAQVLRVKADGAQIFEQTAVFDMATGRFIAAPIDLGPPGEQVFLVLFGTGIRFRSALPAVQLTVGGTNLEALFAGAQGGFVGLDQINALLPRALAGRGVVQIALAVDGKPANVVEVSIR